MKEVKCKAIIPCHRLTVNYYDQIDRSGKVVGKVPLCDLHRNCGVDRLAPGFFDPTAKAVSDEEDKRLLKEVRKRLK